MGAIETIQLKARDATGQRQYAITGLRTDTTVQELIAGLVARMGLPTEDAGGVPQSFHAFLERDGRHLGASEAVGESLQNDDEIVLQPDVQAGGRA